ncbi:kinesin-like nuclear fusion protein [Sporothrix eucalyptigena]
MSPILNVEERLREVESQFSSMKDVMNESLADRKSLEEVPTIFNDKKINLKKRIPLLKASWTHFDSSSNLQQLLWKMNVGSSLMHLMTKLASTSESWTTCAEN